MKATREKNCFCHTCGRAFHYLGITGHRAAHRRRKEVCRITYSNGDTYVHRFESFGSMKRAMIATAEPGPEKNDD